MIYELSGYKTHEPEVDRFHLSRAKTKIVSSPARTSKSYAAWKDVFPDVLYHGVRFLREPNLKSQIIWIVAPNYDLAKEFHYAWEDLIERKAFYGFDYDDAGSTFNVKQGNMTIRLSWGKNKLGQDVKTIISVKSAANERQLQSEELDIVLLSEAARLQEQVWSKYLSTRAGRSVWATTPDIEAAWIFKMIEQGKANPTLGIESFSFTPRANPEYKYDRFWIEHQKAELRSDPAAKLIHPRSTSEYPSVDNGHDCFDPLVECKAMKDAGFAEQFGGQWTFTRGRVVPIRAEIGLRGEPSHVITDAELPVWTKYADVHISCDYGFSDPTVVMFWLVGPKQIILRSSIYERGLTPDDVAERVDAMLKLHGWHGRVKRMVGDPKKPEVTEVFRRRKLPIWDVDKAAQVDRKAGHLELMNMLSVNPKTREPYMLIHSDNIEVIDEWMVLRYRDAIKNHYSEGAFIGRDDAYDCARYYVMSRPPIENATQVVRLDDTDFAKARRLIMLHALKKRRQTVPLAGSGGLARLGM